jgi:hypothetical protein
MVRKKRATEPEQGKQSGHEDDHASASARPGYLKHKHRPSKRPSHRVERCKPSAARPVRSIWPRLTLHEDDHFHPHQRDKQ